VFFIGRPEKSGVKNILFTTSNIFPIFPSSHCSKQPSTRQTLKVRVIPYQRIEKQMDSVSMARNLHNQADIFFFRLVNIET
jgi:hypothetical protein